MLVDTAFFAFFLFNLTRALWSDMQLRVFRFREL